MVVRQRLLDAFRVLRPVTLLSAPAGYGKTLVTESWAASAAARHTVVRVTLDQDALAPRSFWAAALDALGANGLDVSGVSLRSAEGADLRPLLRWITAHDGAVVLVLDTGEFSLSPAVGAGLDWVIRRCRDELMVILLTRTDPPLPLNRYRLDGAITELRADDLAFTAEEVADLMARQGLDLTSADVSLLHARTGGWPAGLMFAAMTLADRADVARALEDFRGDSGNVAEYFFSEVLSKQSQASRAFLLRTCVADELNPELVEALTGEPCDLRLLEHMARSNSFIERVPGHHHRYRYQVLFLEFLRGQLAFERPDLVGELHRVTAEWLAEDGRVFAAIRHAALAGEWQTACELLVTRLGVVRILAGWKSHQLGALFSDLPANLPGAAVAITRAALSISELDLERGKEFLAVAHGVASSGSSSLAPTHGLVLAVLDAIDASLGADTAAGLRAALVAEQALRLTPSRDVDALLELHAIVAGCKARVLFERGDLDAAAHALSDGCRAAEAGLLDGVIIELTGMAAVVEAANGHLRRATELALQVLPTVSDPDEPLSGPGLEAASLALAWVRIDQFATQRPRELLAQADRQPASYDSRVLAPVSALLRARLLQSENQHELALAELHSAKDVVSPSGGTGHSAGWPAAQLVAAEAISLVRLSRQDDAATLLQHVDGPKDASSDLVLHRARVAAGVDDPDTRVPAEPVGQRPLTVQVDELILSAERAIERRAPDRATESIARALQLASREQLRRPFLEVGDQVRRVLEGTDLSGRTSWLWPPAASRTGGVVDRHPPARPPGSPAAHPDAPVVVMPLTAKESEVLGYLGELLTTDEIAATMFVSVNTVRSHVRSILRKLGASRRNEAVRRAWDLGILLPEDAGPPSVAH